jgi:hypothetical protein
METQTPANKEPLLELKLIERLKEAEESVKAFSKRSYIPFPVVFKKICRCFCINKNEAWVVLYELKNGGKIEIIKFKGIKLNSIKNG